MKDSNPYSIWFWKDWERDTVKLTLAEKGLWIDLIGNCTESPTPGEWVGPFSALLGYGESMESVWRHVQALGSKGVADIQIMIGGQMQPMTCENYAAWGEFKPIEMTPLKVVCRRVVKQREKQERNAARMRNTRTRRAQTAHTERTNSAHGEHTERTESAQSAHTERTKPQEYAGARDTPISSSKEEARESDELLALGDSPAAEQKKKGGAAKLVDEAFIGEMKQLYGPLGIDVELQAVRAEAWLKPHPRRKFSQGFFANWLAKEKPNPKAARAEGWPEGAGSDGRLTPSVERDFIPD